MATYVITIGGVAKDFFGGPSIDETANGRNKLSAAVFSGDASYRPAIGDEVLVTEDGTRIFGGTIDTPSEAGFGGYGVTAIVTRISAVDFNALPDRRFIAETIAAGTLKAALIRITTYLSSYGVTLDAAQVNGPTLAEIPFDYVTITAALNQLSALTNGEYVWEIDYFKILRMVQASSTAAPFSVVDGDGHAIGDITVEPSAGFYANRVIVRFSAAARTAYAYLAATGNFANTEHVTIGGQTYTLQTVLVNSADNVLIGATYDDTLNNLIAAITHAAGAGTTYGTGTAANASATAYLVRSGLMIATALTAGAGGNSTVCTEACANANWITEGGGAVTTFQLGSDASLTNTVQANDLTEQGSQGLWEQVVSEPSVFDTTIAQALADSYLAKAIAKPKRVRYRTDQVGIHPGMTQTITSTKRNLSGTFIITDVGIRTRSGNYVQREVVAVGGSNLPARWQDDARRLFSGTGGGSTAGGVSVSIVTGGSVSGSGTSGTLVKWTSSTSAVLGDSIITESGAAVTVAGTLTASTEISVTHATSPSYYLVESGAGSNLKNWRWNVASGVLTLQTVNDARSSVVLTAMSVVRATGALTISAGLTAGSGAVGIIDSTGKIPALTSTYFTSLAFAASNLTGQVAGANGGTGINTTGATGIPQLTASVWAISVTLQNAIQDNITRLGTISTAGSFASTLHVVGNFDVNTSKFTVAAASGNTLVAGTLGITGDTTFAANAGTSSFVSQTTGWRVGVAGDADVRSLYTEAVHAKSFMADIEQASAGGRLETKGVAVIASAFTVPGVGAAVTSIVRVGATATVTTTTAHGLQSGDLATITGAVQTEYNGFYTISITDTTHFTYTVSGTPATPATGTIIARGTRQLDVEDLPGAADLAVFADGDYVVLRSFTRTSSGGLLTGDAIGTVQLLSTAASGSQTFYWVRDLTYPGALAAGTTIAAKSLALDYGVSGSGYIESTVIDGSLAVTSITRSVGTATVTTSAPHGYQTGDPVYISGAVQSAYNGTTTVTVTGATTFTYGVVGAPATPATGTIVVDLTNGTNAPYTQIVTWVTAPSAVNKTVRTRFGNVRGITGTLEYGLFAGDYANKHYVRLTSQNAELVGIPLLLYDGSTNTVKIDPTVPSIALGSTLPSAFGTGTGIWMGKDSSVYKFRVGNPSGNYMKWDGTDLSLASADLSIGSTGIAMTPDGGALVDGRAYKFTVSNGRLGMYGIDNATSRTLNLRAENSTADTPYQVAELTAATPTYSAQVVALAGPGSSSIGLTALEGSFSFSSGLSLAGALAVTGPVSLTGTLSLPSAGADIELGSTGASNTPLIDFHSSGNNIDYDVRLIASGGSGSVGNGTLTATLGKWLVQDSASKARHCAFASVSLVNNATTTLGAIDGLLVVVFANRTALFNVTQAAGTPVTLISDPAAAFSVTSGTGGRVNVYIVAGVVTVENKNGSTQTIYSSLIA